MAIKKSELYSSLWQSCDELRGGMDASQYKDYVLVLLFLKYVSDKFSGKPYAPIVIPPGASFTDMVALKGKSDIGDQINKKILGPLALANKLSDMPDFNDPAKLGDGKEKVDRLTNLIAIFENPALDFSQNRADGDDLLGDAYEYLMRHFATESGKSKGQFYTPAEVSRIMAQILGIRNAKTTNETTVYDPTCGSGSLLLKIGDEAQRGKDVKVTLYGQEKDNATAGLARMNMILHDYATADIKQGNTLANPLFTDGTALKTFDYVVANPPFSDKRWSTGLTPDKDPYGRFEGYGVPPSKQGDYAYLLHILRSIKPTGKGACILPHGVLFRGNAEGVIRKNLIQRGLIKAIIGLPGNLFYGTGIPACIILLDKEGANARKGIFMIDASKGFRKDGPKNRLREQDLHRIVDIFTKQIETPGFARMVPVSEISDEKNDYNLNLPRYIDGTEAEDLQDIEGHLRGGIPNRDLDNLKPYWDVIPAVRAALFKEDRPGYSQLNIAAGDIKPAIFGHPEFTTFNAKATKLFADWKAANVSLLKSFDKDGHPKALIESISESLLEVFENSLLLDCYDIYQHLMDFWDKAMQDDCYLISADGWIDSAQPKLIIEEKGKKNKIDVDFIAGKKKYAAELIPSALLIARYFKNEQFAIDELESQLAILENQLEEMAEEHAGEGGLLEEAKNEKDKLTKASATARLKEIKTEKDVDEEHKALQDYLALVEQESDANARIKEAHEALFTKVLAKYGQLSEGDIKIMVVEDKWITALAVSVQDELGRVSQTLTGRVRELAERYEKPLPQIADEAEAMSKRVDEHLKKMGLAWK
ncbi:type I restriction-modification system subunit M [Polynucleobacter ibericus]|uniref:type I restriction-modification system subunit M n=1 Tax=Polynucleobacter ibericus TaxID=1819725 RepID=UPI001BFDDC29|nr:class I SAM-dependent DNA methyltransferase [Polynucleobacter ibericus]QWE07913.1 N-6 DNA methylase [Polynucleobacter ibericus]